MTKATTTTEQLDDALIEARRALDALETLAREPCGAGAVAAVKSLNDAAIRIADLRDVQCRSVAKTSAPVGKAAKRPLSA